MKHSSLCLGLVFLSALSLRADLVIVQKVDAPGHSGEMTIKIKENLVRMDITPEMSAITDTTAGTITTLMHRQKQCMKMDLASTRMLMEQVQKAKGSAKDDTQAKLTATGQKETINGFETAIYTSKVGGASMKYWIAKDFPQAEKIIAAFKQMQQSPMAAMARQMASQPTDFPGVPVKVEINQPGAQTSIVTTIVSAKEQPLDASEFAVPADYQTLEMPSFGGAGMPGAHPARHKTNPASE